MISKRALMHLGFNRSDFVLRNDGKGEDTFIAQWNSDQPQPSVAEIETAHAEWQAEYDAQEYARNRREEYPSIEECVHAILDDQLDALQVKRQAVKAKYPKS